MIEDLPAGTEQVRQRTGTDVQEGRERESEEHRQPHGLHTDVGSICGLAGTESPCDALGRAVGEEVGTGEHERQDRRGDGESGELLGSEPADDGGVDQHIDRLHRERSERGERERHDSSIDRRQPAGFDGVHAGSRPIAP